MTRLKKVLVAGLTAATATAMLAGPAMAQTTAGPPIGPAQYFAGQVNGNLGRSTLSVEGCSPSSPGTGAGTGRLLPGQTVEATRFVVPPPGVGGHVVGYTAAAHSVSADLEVALPNPPLVYLVHVADLNEYNTTAPLPFMLSLPCDATVTAVFAPINGGGQAVSSQVGLLFATPAIVTSKTTVHPGQTITLHGTGFVPNASFAVEECSQTGWVAGQDPCVDTNRITVRTGPNGAFKHDMIVAACSPALAASCYIGDPIPSGVDTIHLAGVARITVL